ncbi:hypothetical protein PF003_g115 [Phytophthora fragariae]|nr:hypothetical protein PF003_g115 [Phytophthora fragariae]
MSFRSGVLLTSSINMPLHSRELLLVPASSANTGFQALRR